MGIPREVLWDWLQGISLLLLIPIPRSLACRVVLVFFSFLLSWRSFCRIWQSAVPFICHRAIDNWVVCEEEGGWRDTLWHVIDEDEEQNGPKDGSLHSSKSMHSYCRVVTQPNFDHWIKRRRGYAGCSSCCNQCCKQITKLY